MICPTCKKEVEIVKRETDEFGRISSYFSCGHRLVEIAIQNSENTYSLSSIKKKGPVKVSKNHKFELEELIGKRVGKDRKVAFIHQIVDRVKNYYKKFVEVDGKIIKNIEGKLTDHKWILTL